MPPTLELHEEPYDGPAGQALVAAVQQEYVARYGGPDETPVTPAEFAPPDGRFLVGYVDAVPVATGGLRRIAPDTAEIKRMFVTADFRGCGFARQVLARLEDLARELGATRVVLETGPRQPEAVRLYETSGYRRLDGFGHYAAEGGLGFEKSLAAGSQVTGSQVTG